MDPNRVHLLTHTFLYAFRVIEHQFCPGWCGSVDLEQVLEPKGRQFDSQSGHIPELQARTPVGAHMRSNHTLIFLTPFPSLKKKKKNSVPIAIFEEP